MAASAPPRPEELQQLSQEWDGRISENNHVEPSARFVSRFCIHPPQAQISSLWTKEEVARCPLTRACVGLRSLLRLWPVSLSLLSSSASVSSFTRAQASDMASFSLLEMALDLRVRFCDSMSLFYAALRRARSSRLTRFQAQRLPARC